MLKNKHYAESDEVVRILSLFIHNYIKRWLKPYQKYAHAAHLCCFLLKDHEHIYSLCFVLLSVILDCYLHSGSFSSNLKGVTHAWSFWRVEISLKIANILPLPSFFTKIRTFQVKKITPFLLFQGHFPKAKTTYFIEPSLTDVRIFRPFDCHRSAIITDKF